MRNTRLLGDTYTIPQNFDPRDYLETAWGVIGTSGGESVAVKLRFAPEAAHRLRRRLPEHEHRAGTSRRRFRGLYPGWHE